MPYGVSHLQWRPYWQSPRNPWRLYMLTLLACWSPAVSAWQSALAGRLLCSIWPQFQVHKLFGSAWWRYEGSSGFAASKGETGIQDAASADAADMIARAKAKAKQLEGPGISVLHEASTIPHHQYPALVCARRSEANMHVLSINRAHPTSMLGGDHMKVISRHGSLIYY